MKNLSYVLSIGVALSTLFSCASIQQVADDDVYVTKNPQMTTTEEVNDVSSYENYRYRKNNRLFATRYGRTSGLHFYPSTLIAYNCGYSPFNDPFYYPHQYGTSYGNGMYYQYGNYDTYCYSPYYNNYYGNNYYYGNGFYNGYNNYNNNNNNSNNWNNPKPTNTSYNTHYGPRNTFAGVNNYGRGTGKKAGISKQTSTFSKSTHSEVIQKREISKGNTTGTVASTNHRNIGSEVKTSRPVTSGSGLTKTSTRVVTTSRSHESGTPINRNTSSSSSSGSSTRSSGNWSTGSSGSSTRSSESSGSGVKSSGSSSGSHSSPRGGGSGGSSTPVKRGGR